MKKSGIFVYIILALALCFAAAETNMPDEAYLEIVFMDIGNNDGILLSSGGEYAFIDSGNYANGVQAAARMKELGVETLKYYIGTHAHYDHVGGASAILGAFETESVLVPHAGVARMINRLTNGTADENAAAASAKCTVLSAGESVMLGDAELICIAPVTLKSTSGSTDSTENSNSMVLRVEIGDVKILLTGDATTAELLSVLKLDSDALKCDVLKNPHHGAQLNETVLNAIDGEIVIFSVASKGLPHLEYSDWFANNGYDVYMTATRVNGEVRLYTDGSTITVTPTYENNRAAWDAVYGMH